MDKEYKYVKIMTLGDEGSGKVKLLQCLCRKLAPNEQLQTSIFEGHSIRVETAANSSFVLSLWDVSGQENYSSLRCLQYPNMDLFLACFSLTDQQSLINIKEKWTQELRKYCPKAPVILVGTKLEKRNEEKTVTTSQGLEMRQLIGATDYVECSYKTSEGLEKLLTEITKNEWSNKQTKKTFHTCAII